MRQTPEQLRLPEVHGPSEHPYVLRRSLRRRRTIEISIAPTGDVSVAAPMHTPYEEIDAFVRRKWTWVQRTRTLHQRTEQVRTLADGAQLLWLGQSLTLAIRDDGGRSVLRDGDMVVVRVREGLSPAVREAEARRRLEAWYRREAQRVFAERTAHYEPLVGARARRVLVRAQKTRWGSCGADGTVRLNWALVMAPLAIVDYIVVHELCHLKQNGHGKRFWSLVARVLPDYAWRRALLRREGTRFGL